MQDLQRELEKSGLCSITSQEIAAQLARTHKDQEQEDNSRKRQARKNLLKLIKSCPNWQQALKLPSEQEKDVEIIAQLARADSPRATLRAAGCNAVQAAQAAKDLLPLAVAYKAPPNRMGCCKKIGCRLLCAGVLVLFALLCLAGYLYYLVLEKYGWKPGKCNIKQFSNSSIDVPCTGNCVFDIGVREETELLTMYNWEPKLEKDPYRSGTQVRLKADEFRCCSMEDTIHCCSFVDKSFRFCDNWPEKSTKDGEACPSGNWPCLFKTDSDNPKVVLELKPDYEVPMQRIALYMTIAFFSVALLVGIVGHPSVYRRLETGLANTFAKMHLWVDEEERKALDANREFSRPEVPKPFQANKSVMVDSELKAQFAMRPEVQAYSSQPHGRSSVLSQPRFKRSSLSPARGSSILAPVGRRAFISEQDIGNVKSIAFANEVSIADQTSLRTVADQSMVVEDVHETVNTMDTIGSIANGTQSIARSEDDRKPDTKEEVEQFAAYESIRAGYESGRSLPSGGADVDTSDSTQYVSVKTSDTSQYASIKTTDTSQYASIKTTDTTQYTSINTTDSMRNAPDAGNMALANTVFSFGSSQTTQSGRTLKEIAEQGKTKRYGDLFRPIVTPPTGVGTRGSTSPLNQTARSATASGMSSPKRTNTQQRKRAEQRVFPLAKIDDRSPTGFSLERRVPTEDPTKWGWGGNESSVEVEGLHVVAEDRLAISIPDESNRMSSSQKMWHPALAASQTSWSRKPLTADSHPRSAQQRGRHNATRTVVTPSMPSRVRSKVADGS